MKKTLFKIALIVLLPLLLLGCLKQNPALSFIGPIPNWSDVTLPKDAIWQNTVISGKIENHNYLTTLSKPKTLEYIEEGMAYNGWLLTSSAEETRSYAKNEDHVTINLKQSTEGKIGIVIIIEPKDTYEENLEPGQ
ncbi:MAG: hypothetical protein UT36_C0004G0092 [Candidatus Peregrinibacteria bacterium GW2011_GWF2_39_17]|nr:MAG: hypothetical protein UT36_C0004G0092 [Candidatus Peregrinibacteria bacterium GW2011_GWF2_39_17]HCW32219.1 hypothetical protein [Candidatus Peregrinibacteria bacterium]